MSENLEMFVLMFFLIAKTQFMCIIRSIDTKQVILMGWHPAQVEAALEMSGTNLFKLAKEHGYAHINEVLHRPWVAEEGPMKVAAISEPASEPSSNKRGGTTVRRGSVKTEGRACRAGGA